MADIVIAAILAGALGLWALICTLRRLWATELVQSRVLRWTGHSYYVPTSWMHDRPTVRSGTNHSAAFQVTFAAVWGSLVGSLSVGIRRTPARASAPASPSLPGDGVAGSTARPDAPPSPGVHPGVGAGTLGPHAMRADAALPRAAARQGGPKLAAAAQCSGPRAAAVDQPAGES
jgi:hypothetical protein